MFIIAVGADILLFKSHSIEKAMSSLFLFVGVLICSIICCIYFIKLYRFYFIFIITVYC